MSSFDTTPLASDNERMILDIVRRRGPIIRSAITGHTNLTQQSVHRLLEGLIKRGVLKTGAAPKGARGQPSPSIDFVADAAYSVGVAVNTDSAILCLADLRCHVVIEETITTTPADRVGTIGLLVERLNAILQERKIGRDRLVGLGFAMSGFFVDGKEQYNAPEPLEDWSLIDLRPILEEAFGLPVWMENNATTGAVGESLRGVGLWCSTFAYLSFNYGFGGGLILNGTPYLGFHGNAGEMSGIYDPEEAHKRPALQYLIAALRRHGIDVGSVENMRRMFDPAWPGVEEWLAETMPLVNRLIATLIAVIDPQAIVFGGQIPPQLGRIMIERVAMPSSRPHRYDRAPREARLVLSEASGDASVLGAALLPLKFRLYP